MGNMSFVYSPVSLQLKNQFALLITVSANLFCLLPLYGVTTAGVNLLDQIMERCNFGAMKVTEIFKELKNIKRKKSNWFRQSSTWVSKGCCTYSMKSVCYHHCHAVDWVKITQNIPQWLIFWALTEHL